MSFLRRLSTAAGSFLPSVPNASGTPARHVPRRATETFSRKSFKNVEEGDEEEEEEDVKSRASWELSDTDSVKSASTQDSGSQGSDSAGESSRGSLDSTSDTSFSDSDSEFGEDGLPRDRYDMMVRHLWNVGERSGWFRDAHFDGLVSIRYV